MDFSHIFLNLAIASKYLPI